MVVGTGSAGGIAPGNGYDPGVIETARKRGIRVDTATIEELFFDGKAMAWTTGADSRRQRTPFDEYALVLMRKEPPYDLAFHYATQLLSLTRAIVVNDPSALRDFNEKLIALQFAEYMPPTMVASDPALLTEFVASNGVCVLKSLDSFQGRAVERIETPDEQRLQLFTGDGRYPVMVQRFLEDVYDGDKRVLLLGGQFLGAALRRPKQGFHASFARSDAISCGLTQAEQQIVDRVGPWLVEHGIHFAGLDFIGERLTEINITCPTGIRQIGLLDQRDLAAEIVDYLSALTARAGS
ncbi:MAG: glutathione synthase [Desulfofustis sp.]|nr:glutathione synthase [Desulfofustis sp.]